MMVMMRMRDAHAHKRAAAGGRGDHDDCRLVPMLAGGLVCSRCALSIIHQSTLLSLFCFVLLASGDRYILQNSSPRVGVNGDRVKLSILYITALYCNDLIIVRI